MSEELKPCPFCGDKAHINPLSGDPDDSHEVCCYGCGGFAWGDTKEKAIRKWNRRVEIPHHEAKPARAQRPSKDECYLGIAEAVLARSTCLRRKYGAVIVKDDEIISTGYNGSPRDEKNCSDTGYCYRETEDIPHGERYESCLSVQAEANAIISASRRDMLGSTLYLSGQEADGTPIADPEPCLMCYRLILNAGIAKIVTRNVDGAIMRRRANPYLRYALIQQEEESRA